MNDEIISAILGWNPWFEGDFPENLIGFERDYPILTYLEVPEIKVLEGVRRSGKSTLLYNVAKHAVLHEKKVLYINFEDEILSRYSLSELYYAFLKYSAVDYLLIDEVQYCVDWVSFVRKIYDRKELEQIWVTGSNSSLIKKEYAEMLTGRNLKMAIAPLTFSEYLKFKGINNDNKNFSKQTSAVIRRYFDEYIKHGAFPAIVLREVLKRDLLNNYFEDFLYKDIAGRYKVDVNKLKELAIYLATNSAKTLSYRNTAARLGLHANTVNDYVGHLCEVFLFRQVYRFNYALKKQYANDKKIYMVDTGLANTISFRFSEDKGRMLETLVCNELFKRGHEVYYHCDKRECDFVIKTELDISQAIQVAWSLDDPETKERELAGLMDAIAHYKTQDNLIITLDEEAELILEVDAQSYRVSIVPIWKWLLNR